MVEPVTVPELDAKPFTHSRLYDLAAATPLMVVYGFASVGNVILISGQWSRIGEWSIQLSVASKIATSLFFGLQIVLCLLRRLPLKKSEGLWPRATAILGANSNFVLLLLPQATLGLDWTTISATLTIAGTVGSLAILFFLGRSFSIFPEARSLVTEGPYRYIRHPLYLAELISTLGIMLQFRQPWAALVVAATLAFQLRRMGHEEGVLRRTFADYDGYAKRTARLIPGLY